MSPETTAFLANLVISAIAGALGAAAWIGKYKKNVI